MGSILLYVALQSAKRRHIYRHIHWQQSHLYTLLQHQPQCHPYTTSPHPPPPRPTPSSPTTHFKASTSAPVTASAALRRLKTSAHSFTDEGLLLLWPALRGPDSDSCSRLIDQELAARAHQEGRTLTSSIRFPLDLAGALIARMRRAPAARSNLDELPNIAHALHTLMAAVSSRDRVNQISWVMADYKAWVGRGPPDWCVRAMWDVYTSQVCRALRQQQEQHQVLEQQQARAGMLDLQDTLLDNTLHEEQDVLSHQQRESGAVHPPPTAPTPINLHGVVTMISTMAAVHPPDPKKPPNNLHWLGLALQHNLHTLPWSLLVQLLQALTQMRVCPRVLGGQEIIDALTTHLASNPGSRIRAVLDLLMGMALGGMLHRPSRDGWDVRALTTLVNQLLASETPTPMHKCGVLTKLAQVYRLLNIPPDTSGLDMHRYCNAIMQHVHSLHGSGLVPVVLFLSKQPHVGRFVDIPVLLEHVGEKIDAARQGVHYTGLHKAVVGLWHNARAAGNAEVGVAYEDDELYLGLVWRITHAMINNLQDTTPIVSIETVVHHLAVCFRACILPTPADCTTLVTRALSHTPTPYLWSMQRLMRLCAWMHITPDPHVLVHAITRCLQDATARGGKLPPTPLHLHMACDIASMYATDHQALSTVLPALRACIQHCGVPEQPSVELARGLLCVHMLLAGTDGMQEGWLEEGDVGMLQVVLADGDAGGRVPKRLRWWPWSAGRSERTMMSAVDVVGKGRGGGGEEGDGQDHMEGGEEEEEGFDVEQHGGGDDDDVQGSSTSRQHLDINKRVPTQDVAAAAVEAFGSNAVTCNTMLLGGIVPAAVCVTVEDGQQVVLHVLSPQETCVNVPGVQLGEDVLVRCVLEAHGVAVAVVGWREWVTAGEGGGRAGLVERVVREAVEGLHGGGGGGGDGVGDSRG